MVMEIGIGTWIGISEKKICNSSEQILMVQIHGIITFVWKNKPQVSGITFKAGTQT